MSTKSINKYLAQKHSKNQGNTICLVLISNKYLWGSWLSRFSTRVCYLRNVVLVDVAFASVDRENLALGKGGLAEPGVSLGKLRWATRCIIHINKQNKHPAKQISIREQTAIGSEKLEAFDLLKDNACHAFSAGRGKKGVVGNRTSSESGFD